MTVDLSRLPKPSEYGSYWFGRRAEPADPAIFRSGRKKDNGDVVYSGKYFLFLGSQKGILCENDRIKYFDTPEEALKNLRRLLSV